MRARPAHGERERPGALGSVRGALDSTQTQQTDNSVPSALLRPPSGYYVNRLLGPGDGRRESGTGRKSWPPRSRFPSLVSYRLDHIDWKPEGSNLWTQGYWKRRQIAPNPRLRRAPPPPRPGFWTGFWPCAFENHLLEHLQAPKQKGSGGNQVLILPHAAGWQLKKIWSSTSKGLARS